MSHAKKRSLTIVNISVTTLIISYFLFFNTENISVEVDGASVIKVDVIRIMS
jgi:hypothetical protein